MVALQIRDVPDDVRRTLAERAAAHGQSMQSFLLTLVTEEARRSRNLAVLEAVGERRAGSTLTNDELDRILEQAGTDRETR